jgi:hypothetical protein
VLLTFASLLGRCGVISPVLADDGGVDVQGRPLGLEQHKNKSVLIDPPAAHCAAVSYTAVSEMIENLKGEILNFFFTAVCFCSLSSGNS